MPPPEEPGPALPAGACDCHVHVIGDRADYPMVPGRHYTPGPAPVEALRRHMARLGLERAVIVQPSVYGTDNRCLLDALERLDGRARGVAVPPEDASPTELRRMDARGVRGVRLNLESSGSRDIAALQDALAAWSHRIADLGWHLQLYAASDVLVALADTLSALPVPVVLDHFALARAPGRPEDAPDATAIANLLTTGRVFVKLSAPYRLPAPGQATAWARLFGEAAPGAILWGSDWPHTARRPGAGPLDVSPYRDVPPLDLAATLREWLPTEASRRLALVDTPSSVYGF